MTSYYDPNSFLMASGGRSAKFEKEGDRIVGYITSMDVRQQTDIKSGEPKFWDDAQTQPMMQLVVTLETEIREDEDDDGMRSVYIRGQMQRAVSDAVRKAGERGLANNGKLGVQYDSTDAPKQRGFNGAKRYNAKYEAPVSSVNFDEDIDNADPF